MFIVLSFWDGDKALLQSIKITVLTFLVKKKLHESLRVRVCIMTILEKTLSQSRPPRLRIKRSLILNSRPQDNDPCPTKS